ncbi:S8 family serine peptidase [Actinokineospora sp. HUAS TT18]|uniref:S8 family peptidase n=1 Tax=Actinokineospora sp. HUAS TT18 TaxID=3447451 RepID=UPI003F525415
MRHDRKTRRRVLVASVAAGASALALAVVTSAPASAQSAEIRHANQANSVAGSYVVKFKDSVGSTAVAAKAQQLAGKHGGKLSSIYKAVGGFSVQLSEAQAKQLAADPSVAYVEQDQIFHITDTQQNPTWGLDRTDQRDLPVSNTYTYPSTAGAGVTAYILDTGVDASHPDFGGRVKGGYDFIDNDSNAADCQGHGTHVAGTVGSATYGIAKKVNLVSVRVLDCGGYSKGSSITQGIDWVVQNAQKPAVINMSLGGGASSILDDGARKAINAGIITVVAAGNNGGDACQISPARTPEAITVAASDGADKRSIWTSTQSSNWGTCVDIFGPGSNIISTKNGGGTFSNGGTSMATPHVVGAVALYLGTSGNSGKTQAEVAKVLIDNSTPNKITDVKGSPNRLLYTGFLNGPVDPPCSGASNSDDVAIPDNNTAVTSSVNVTGCSGGGTSATSVKVDINHTYTGDLKVELVGPSGAAFVLKQPGGASSAGGIHTTYTVNTGSETAKNGTWRLRVTDVYRYDTGNIDAWTLTF